MVEQVRQVRGRKRRRMTRQEWREMQRRVYEATVERGDAPRGINWVKWGLGLAGLGMLFFAGLTLALLIILPVWFRSLPTSEQVVWMNRVPALEAFRPTREYNADRLPTGVPNPTAAMALLTSPVANPTIDPASSSDDGTLAVGGNAFNLEGAGGNTPVVSAPVNLVGTTGTPTASAPAGIAFCDRPTSVLATTTPVLAAIAATPTPPAATGPVASPSPTPTLPPPPTATQIPVPSSYQLDGFSFVRQNWNTCGPANLTQGLRYYAWSGGQDDITDRLRPIREDRNVSPWELVSYVNEVVNAEQGYQLKALMRVGGTIELAKRLVAGNFAVILEKGYILPQEGWLGHYLTLQGFDDSRAEMHSLDTYLGDRWEDYETLDRRWQMFNRLFIVIYPAERERELSALLGPHRDVTYSIQFALSTAIEEASSQPDNPYAWFNIGSSYTMLRDYQRAADAFDQAFTVGGGLPPRMLWYQFTPYEAYYNVSNLGQVLSLTRATLGTSQDLEESHYWRGMAQAAQGDTQAAIGSFERALMINPTYAPARDQMERVRDGTFRPPTG